MDMRLNSHIGSDNFNYDVKINSDDYSLFIIGAAESEGANISRSLPETGNCSWPASDGVNVVSNPTEI
jgi:hypothetical protein